MCKEQQFLKVVYSEKVRHIILDKGFFGKPYSAEGWGPG